MTEDSAKPDFIIRATEATGKAEGYCGLIPSWKNAVGYRGERVGRGELPGVTALAQQRDRPLPCPAVAVWTRVLVVQTVRRGGGTRLDVGAGKRNREGRLSLFRAVGYRDVH